MGSFRTVYICNDCSEEFDSKTAADGHNCGQTLSEIAANKAWEARYKLVCDAWKSWCLADNKVGIHGTPSVDHLPDEVAHHGRCIFVASADRFWGGKESAVYSSPMQVNPTWGTVFKLFEDSMYFTKDYHHCFLEGIARCNTHLAGKLFPNQDPSFTLFTFITGS